MKKTENYEYNLPEREDKVRIDDLNQNTENMDADITNLNITLQTKADIDSPQFVGEPTAPIASISDDAKRIATVGTVNEVVKSLEVIEL